MKTFINTNTAVQKAFAILAIFALVLMPMINVNYAEAAASADLSQAENGKASAPKNPVEWVNGNVNEAKGHYTEGESIPYRMEIDGLVAGVQSELVIGFDVIKSQGQTSKFAIDYITSDDRISETVSPCDGSGICTNGDLTPDSTFNIPSPNYIGALNGYDSTDVLNSFNELVGDEGAQVIKMWGGTINDVDYSVVPDLSTDEEAQVTILFTPTGTSAVISWGGHISSSVDYPGESAVTISGSPYHTRLISINGSGGNQDRSLSASAVTFPGNLIVIKTVDNAGGGTLDADDFTINVNITTAQQTASPSQFLGDEGGTFVDITVPKNGTTTYAVAEVEHPDYEAGYSDECVGGVTSLQQKVCTITNTYIPPTATITLVKVADNTAGGSALSTAWTLSADGPTDISGETGDAEITNAVVTPGTYVLSESTGPDRYNPGAWICDGGTQDDNELTLVKGDDVTCTITNTYVPAEKASITVVKTVVNDNGGTAGTSTFQYFVNGVTQVFSGIAAFFDAEEPTEFTLSESNVAGYASSTWGGNCAANGTVTLDEGGSATCTITNNDISPKLTINKIVINDDETADELYDATDFNLFADAIPFVNGIQQNVDAGTYTLSETGPTVDYGASYSCVVNGGQPQAGNEVTLALADVAVCTITNDDNEPTESTITIYKQVINDFGGDAVASDFSFLVNGAATTSFEGDTLNGSKQIIVTQAGDYNITEPNRIDYVEDYSQCMFDNVELGNSYSCTIINTELPECSDGIDNDGDRIIDDVNNDPGCDGPGDDSEDDPETTITIDKEVTGEGADVNQAFNFDFSWTGIGVDIALSASGTPIETVLQPAQGLVISEDLTNLSRWNIESIACSSENNPSVNDLDQNPNTVTLNFSVGEQITCVFTNEYTPRDSGTNEENIIIKKEVTEGSDVETFFSFDGSWLNVDGPADFVLKNGQQYDSGDLDADMAYTINEMSLPEGWSLSDITCDDEFSNDEGESDIEVFLDDGETITCTYTNHQTIEVPACNIGENLLLNGSFEEPEVDGDWGIFGAVTNWLISTDGLELWNNFMGGASDADQNAELDGNSPTSITQTVATTPGATYELRFDFSPRPATGLEDNNVDALADGNVVINASADGSENESTDWTTYSQTFVAGDDSTDIAFADKGTANGLGSLVDNAVLCFVSNPDDGDDDNGGGGGGGGTRISLDRDGGNDDDEDEPTPQVLGESTDIIPVGAPNTGFGGTSNDKTTATLFGLLAMFMALGTLKVTSKNVR